MTKIKPRTASAHPSPEGQAGPILWKLKASPDEFADWLEDIVPRGVQFISIGPEEGMPDGITKCYVTTAPLSGKGFVVKVVWYRVDYAEEETIIPQHTAARFAATGIGPNLLRLRAECFDSGYEGNFTAILTSIKTKWELVNEDIQSVDPATETTGKVKGPRNLSTVTKYGALYETIEKLLKEGNNITQIAAQLDISRDTVRRIIHWHDSKKKTSNTDQAAD